MDLYPAVLAFLKDHGLHKTATMLEREADCQIPVEAHPNLLDLYASHLKRSRESEESDGPPPLVDGDVPEVTVGRRQ